MQLHQIGNPDSPAGCSGAPGQPEERKTLAEFLSLYDQRAKRFHFDGPRYRIPYTVMGDGPPLYIVQGIGSVQRLYACLSVELSRRFRVITYELPGTTPNDGCNIARYELDDYTKDLLLLADHLGDEQFFAAGNSFGVSITLRTMFARPDRLTMALIAGGFTKRKLSVSEKVLLFLLKHWPGKVRHIPILRAVNRYNHGRELDMREDTLMPFLGTITNDIPLKTLARQVIHVGSTDLSPILSKLENPLMILHGESDRMVTPEHAVELSKGPKNLRVMTVPDCGHLPHLSHPELYAHACEWFFLGAVTPHCPSLAGNASCSVVS